MQGGRMLGVLCLIGLLAVTGAERQLSSVTTNQQTSFQSILWDPAGGKGSSPIYLNDSRLQPANGPEQVHLTYLNSTAVVVSWVTGNGTFMDGPMTLGPVTNPYGNMSTVNITTDTAKAYPVMYGTSSSSLTGMASGVQTTYAQIYTGFVNDTGFGNSNPIQNYSSPLLHHVILTSLTPNTTYFYQVSGGKGVNSSTFNFTTPPALGQFPLRMGVMADVGQTYNSSETLARALRANTDVLTLIGDWTYADDYTTTGTCLVIGFPNNTFTGNNISSPSGSFQTRWDTWFRLAQPLLSHIPIIPNSGNHELEPQGSGRYFQTSPWGVDNGRQFNSYLARVPQAYLGTQSGGGFLYFSTDVGPVHYITLSNYENFLVGSPQFQFLLQDLAKVNRTRTPWVVASWHAPWYSSYTTHYKETESMRVTMEPLLHEAGVDIVLGGHLHEYERTHAIFNYQNNNCGTVYINVGDGGNVEGLYTTFIDEPGSGNCPAPGIKAIPNYQPGPYTPSYTYNLSNAFSGYCPSPAEGAPSWSAYRQPAFGQGVLTFINETVAHWQWNRDIDPSPTNYPDDVYIIRDRSCYNFVANTATYAPLLSPNVAQYVNTSQYEPLGVPTTMIATLNSTASANSPVGGQFLAASG